MSGPQVAGVIEGLPRDQDGNLRGFGFIQPCVGPRHRRVTSQRYFFHSRDLEGAVFDHLRDGMPVLFEPAETPRGLRAVRVVIVPSGPGI